MKSNILPPRIKGEIRNSHIKEKIIIVNCNTLNDLFVLAEVSPKIQNIILTLPILRYSIRLQTKKIQYNNSKLSENDYVFVKLPTSKKEKIYILKQERLIIEDSPVERYIYEEAGKLRVHNGDKNDLPKLKEVWNNSKVKLKKSKVYFGLILSLIRTLPMRKNISRLLPLPLPFPLIRSKKINIFSGTKKELHAIILEDLRHRYELKRDINKKEQKVIYTPDINDASLLISNDPKLENYPPMWIQLSGGTSFFSKLSQFSVGYDIAEDITEKDIFVELVNQIGQLNLPYTIYLLGGKGNVPYKTRNYFISIYPGLKNNFVGISTPPLGFVNDKSKMEAICKDIDSKKPDILFVGLSNSDQKNLSNELLSRNVNFGLQIGVGDNLDLSHKAKSSVDIFNSLRLIIRKI